MRRFVKAVVKAIRSCRSPVRLVAARCKHIHVKRRCTTRTDTDNMTSHKRHTHTHAHYLTYPFILIVQDEEYCRRWLKVKENGFPRRCKWMARNENSKSRKTFWYRFLLVPPDFYCALIERIICNAWQYCCALVAVIYIRNNTDPDK